MAWFKKLLASVKKWFREILFGLEKADSNTNTASPEPVKPEHTSSPEPDRFQQPASLPPAPKMREEIIGFIVQSLRPHMDEKEPTISGLRLYVVCASNEEEELVKVALFAHKPDKFKRDELTRRLTDNFIALPENWSFDYQLLRDKLPACTFKQGIFGLDLVDKRTLSENHPKARLRTLVGQTIKKEYQLNPAKKVMYYIGRGKERKAESGRMHENDIIFLTKDDALFDEEKGGVNVYISQNHAFVKYDPNQRKYFLYADTGGLPISDNKTKILKSDTKVERVDMPGMGYELTDGDQIELGGEAKLVFLNR